MALWTKPMTDLDEKLALLRDEPAPVALSAIGGAVIAGVAAGQERLRGRRALALACGVAAVVGLWGGIAGPQRASAGDMRHEVSGHDEALLGMPAAAPSHLLAS